MAATSPRRLSAPGRERIAEREVRTAVSSTKVESGCCKSASSTCTRSPRRSNAERYAACCSRTFAKDGLPRFPLVKPSSKFRPGRRTIALQSTRSLEVEDMPAEIANESRMRDLQSSSARERYFFFIGGKNE